MPPDVIDLTEEPDDSGHARSHPAPRAPSLQPSLPAPRPPPSSCANSDGNLSTTPQKYNYAYAPLSASHQKISFASNAPEFEQSAEKRRKLSTGPQSRGDGNGVGTEGNHARVNGNRMPTVQSLNSMMKAHNTQVPAWDDFIQTQPKALQIARAGEDEQVDLPAIATRGVGSELSSTHTHVKRQINSAEEKQDIVPSMHNQPLEPGVGTLTSNTTPMPAQRHWSGPLHREAHLVSLLSGAIRSPGSSEQDKIVSRSSPSQYYAYKPTETTPSSTLPTTAVTSHTRQRNSAFTKQEENLIIFLKEVKKVRWKEFPKFFPGRNWYNMQTHYSQKLNKRNRSRDPPVLELPPEFPDEAAIDLKLLYADPPGPIQPDGLPREAVALTQQTVAEPTPQRERPRRAVPVQNYTWPKRNSARQTDEYEDEVNVGYAESQSTDVLMRTEEPSEEPISIPDKAIPVENDPMEMDLMQDARLGLAANERRSKTSDDTLPYLSFRDRLMVQKSPDEWEWDQLCGRNWQGSVVHVDFSPYEIRMVERAIAQVQKAEPRRRLQNSLRTMTEPQLLNLAHKVRKLLPCRDSQSVKAFIEDAQTGKLHTNPRIERIGAARQSKHFCSELKASTTTILRDRELGLQSKRGWKTASTPLAYQLRNKMQDTLGPAYTYTGASSDVHTLSWSPSGQFFAAGAVCVTDSHSLQYNRPNNLLYGNTSNQSIFELGEHYQKRMITESGPNSTQAMFASQDPNLYTTVSSVAFSPNGKYMFSAGYDRNVCVWDVSNENARPLHMASGTHKAEVDMLAVSAGGLVATAAKRHTGNAIKVLFVPDDDPKQLQKCNFHSSQAAKKPDLNILPTALRFEPNMGRVLLAGFGANVREDRPDTNGDICLWDIETMAELQVWGSNKNVFDVSFNANQRSMPWFAAGCVAGQDANRGTRSIIRFFDGRGLGKYSKTWDVECRALDMNDVIFCPHDENYVAAGCTSGRTYIWDLRRGDRILRELSHGKSLMPLDEHLDRQVTDTGVRFLSWGDNATRLYTGSSDGIIKVWDVTRSEENTFIKDLFTADSGIMSGVFSPDMSKLVVGEVNGSVTVLDVGHEDMSSRDACPLGYIPWTDNTATYVSGTGENLNDPDSGIAQADVLLASNQMQYFPMGALPIRQAVQGPSYQGPFDTAIDSPFLREQALEFQLELAAAAEGPHCNIPACRENVVTLTSEEMGDSGRSADRIPQALAKAWKCVDEDHGDGIARRAGLSGKVKCSACGRAARARATLGGSAVDIQRVLCERCSFACFRCGAACVVPPPPPNAKQTYYTTSFPLADEHAITCENCDCAWDTGVLGYECVKDSASMVERVVERAWEKKVSRWEKKGSRWEKKGSRWEKKGSKSWVANAGEDEEFSYGDEDNALQDHYFGRGV